MPFELSVRNVVPFSILLAVASRSFSTNALPIAEKPSFVIVGGGTAGSVLAARLCANLPSATITVLERGPQRSQKSEYITRSPRFAVQTWTDSTLSELIHTHPSQGINNRSVPLVTGSTLGGSSSVNGMQWTVPPFSSVLKWGIRDLLHPSTASKVYRRAFLILGVSLPSPEFTQIHVDKYIQASSKAGFQLTDTPYEQKLENSIWHNRLAVSPTGRRRDAYTMYVKPVLQHACNGRLNIIEGAVVSKLLLSGSNGNRKVVGVEYVPWNGGPGPAARVLVVHEVIVSAGPFGSPKLLQLSGIGPSDVLREAGVAVQHKLPVGRNFLARPAAYIASEYGGPHGPIEPSNNKSNVNSLDESSKWESGKHSAHGMAFSMVNGATRRHGYFIGAMNMPTEDLGLGKPWVLSLCNGNSNARGQMRIRSINPFASLSVSANFLGLRSDMHHLLMCMLKVEEIHHRLCDTRFVRKHIMPKVDQEFLKGISTTAGHYVGGCAVGSVVESNLRVKGIDGVRVIDVSALNGLPQSAGPASSVYMLAEYASEKLVEKYGCFLGGNTSRGNRTMVNNGW